MYLYKVDNSILFARQVGDLLQYYLTAEYRKISTVEIDCHCQFQIDYLGWNL